MGRRAEVLRYFLRLGVVGFGGPGAHLAMMHEELVRRRAWVKEREFLDIVGAANLIPGPSSTAIAIHLGYIRARLLGGVLAGVAFLLPAFVMVVGLAWMYTASGPGPARAGLLAGIQPVVPAVVAVTLWRLRRAFTGGTLLPALAALGLALTLAFPVFSPLVILGGGLVGLGVQGRGAQGRGAGQLSSFVPPLALVALVGASHLAGLPALGWVFLRTGLLLFGGGLVLLPLLGPEVVGRGWLTEREFLDGVALGQLTPGPVVMTAAFVGYVTHGLVGAAVATIGIFLPTFVMVLGGTGPLLSRFRGNTAVSAFVRAVTATALGAVAATAILLLPSALGSPFRAVLLVAAGIALALRAPIAWVVLAGAALGLALGILGWA